MWPNRLRTALIAAVAIALLAPGAVLGRQSTQSFVGVTYSVRTVKDPRPLTMHVAQVDLQAPGIHFKVSPPGGDREVVRQSTLDFLKQEHAQLAINAHY